MEPRILEGRSAADSLRNAVTAEVARLGTTPVLEVLAPRHDSASEHYVRSIGRSAARAGINVVHTSFDADGDGSDVRAAIRTSTAQALQIQKPLPRGLSAGQLLEAEDARDVEGLSPRHVGMLHAGRPQFVPCTALAVWRLLLWHGIALEGRRAVVVGRSDIVGAPLAALLQRSGATVAVLHTRTRSVPLEVQRAEVLVSAAGQRDLCAPSDIPQGCILADVGHHVLEDGSVCGDFSAAHHAVSAAYTPVPGGVGPLTTWCLMEAVVRAAALQRGVDTVLSDPLRSFLP